MKNFILFLIIVSAAFHLLTLFDNGEFYYKNPIGLDLLLFWVFPVILMVWLIPSLINKKIGGIGLNEMSGFEKLLLFFLILYGVGWMVYIDHLGIGRGTIASDHITVFRGGQWITITGQEAKYDELLGWQSGLAWRIMIYVGLFIILKHQKDEKISSDKKRSVKNKLKS